MGSMTELAAQSFRRGLRLLWRDGIFTVLAVGLLGVGLAATMALLAAIDAVILREWQRRCRSMALVGCLVVRRPAKPADTLPWDDRRCLTVSS